MVVKDSNRAPPKPWALESKKLPVTKTLLCGVRHRAKERGQSGGVSTAAGGCPPSPSLGVLTAALSLFGRKSTHYRHTSERLWVWFQTTSVKQFSQ